MKRDEVDAVRMMREIRERLCRKYLDDPEAQDRDLEEIRKKYKMRFFEKKRGAPRTAGKGTPKKED